jgi:hypothetical protein
VHATPGTPIPIQPTPQPPQPPQPTPHRHALHPPQPRQPPHPRAPPHPRQPPHPRASCTPLSALSSSSRKRWKVARLTSVSSSSPSLIIMPGEKFCACLTSPVGTADANALPASENVNPAAPSAGSAVLAMRFFFEACFARGMVASSTIAKKDISVPQSYADEIRQARFMRTRKCNGVRSGCIHLYERCRRIFAIAATVGGDHTNRSDCDLVQCAITSRPGRRN